MTPSGAGKAVGGMEFGDHLCLTYDNPDERLAVLRAYVRDGLAADHKVVYLSDQDPPERVLEWLDPGAPHEDLGLAAALEEGRFAVRTAEEAYMATGRFDPDEIIALFATDIELALVQGYKGVRVTGEETFSLRGWPGTERFAEFERKIDEVFRTSRVNAMAICQYDRRWFDPDQLARLESHHVDRVRADDLYDDGDLRLRPLFGPPGLALDGALTAAAHAPLADALARLPRTGGLICLDLARLADSDDRGLELLAGAGTAGGGRHRQVLLRGLDPALAARLRAAGLDGVPGVSIEEAVR
ncbi:MEDS domain-containing protein [Spirillospora sp. CA-253888]